MTDEERRLSEERRKLIMAQSRAANLRRPNRVIPPADRAEELLARIGVTANDDTAVNWAAIARG